VNDVDLPDNVIGRPGMVAMLRRVRPAAEGRLVALRHPVGMVAPREGARPVFAWQALVLGVPLRCGDRPCNDAVVGDSCLVPVSWLPPLRVERLRKVQALRDARLAMRELGEYLRDHPATAGESGDPLEKALNHVSIAMAHEVVPVAAALREIGFSVVTKGGDALGWSVRHAGSELRFDAGPDWLDGWRLGGVCVGRDRALLGETVLPPQAPRGQVVRSVLRF